MIGIIYKLAMSNTDNTVYIGSTINLRRRKYNHKKSSTHNPAPVYKYIISKGGFQNFDLFEIERIEFTNKKELYEREKHYIKEMRRNGVIVLNKNIPNRNYAEYYQDNKIEIIIKVRTYRINNRPMVLEKKNKRITCQCGVQYTNSNKVNHFKTERHKSYFTRLTNSEVINDIEPSETSMPANVAPAVLV
jgi:predicted GIY-YIG superfamily endonuclease